MLAQTAGDVGDALGRLERAGLEYKLDGVRVQVHRRDDQVRVFSRQLHDVTHSVPEIVDTALALPVRQFVLSVPKRLRPFLHHRHIYHPFPTLPVGGPAGSDL